MAGARVTTPTATSTVQTHASGHHHGIRPAPDDWRGAWEKAADGIGGLCHSVTQHAATWPGSPCFCSSSCRCSTHRRRTRTSCPPLVIWTVSDAPAGLAFSRVSGHRGWKWQPGRAGCSGWAPRRPGRSAAWSAAGWARARPTAGSCVYGCLGLAYSSERARLLHDPAQVHHRHLVGEVLDDGQVVGDEQVGDAPLLLQVVQQVQDLALDRHVQGRDGLVADDEVGRQGQGPGDADALALPAAELVRVADGVAGVEADAGRSRLATRSRFSCPLAMPWTSIGSPMMAADGHPRVEAADRVLEDDLHLPPQPPQLRRRGGRRSRRPCT